MQNNVIANVSYSIFDPSFTFILTGKRMVYFWPHSNTYTSTLSYKKKM